MKMFKKKKKDADGVIAATAGLDSWKTWAGRMHGTDDFEMLDVFRGMRRSFHNRFLAAPPPPGSTCPVCFCETEEWHMTSSCGHAVCLHCFRAYASSQVNDRQQSGPLKCPVCPQVLRRSDAIVALGGDKDLLRAWDVKIRNQLLRALPAYRSCPRCSGDSSSVTTGGGFVTPSCLSIHYKDRRDDALNRIRQGAFGTLFLIVAAYFVMARYIARHPSRSVIVDVFSMLLPFYVMFGRVGRAASHFVARWARNALFRPIGVSCPCCDFEFILPASGTIQDEETKAWLKNNTRLCPSCSVPITKNGGCNHMQCSHCHAKFCWACMRLRTNCAAYNCHNGGVNAVAVLARSGQENVASNNSILERIDQILEREPVKLRIQDGIILCVSLFCRDAGPIQAIISWFMAIFSVIFTTEFVSFCMLVLSLKKMLATTNNQNDGEHNRDVQPEQNRILEQREEAMVALAIQRSLNEQ